MMFSATQPVAQADPVDPGELHRLTVAARRAADPAHERELAVGRVLGDLERQVGDTLQQLGDALCVGARRRAPAPRRPASRLRRPP